MKSFTVATMELGILNSDFIPIIYLCALGLREILQETAGIGGSNAPSISLVPI